MPDTWHHPSVPVRVGLVRKRRYLKALPHKSTSILRVTVADKLHNARAIHRDSMARGPALWDLFNKPPEQTVAYYSALGRILGQVHATPVTAEYLNTVELLESAISSRARLNEFIDELLAE
jgi:hypothetical protein